ncbi:MAG: hypothetical protein WDM88_09735 [Galbitalea sp.]
MGITYHQGARSVSHRFAGSPGRGVRRTTLHDELLRRADELGAVRMTARVRRVEQTGDGVLVAGLSARYLLACDGLHSTVARLVGLAFPVPTGGRRYGIRQHYALPPWGDTVEVHYGRRAEFYVTPVAPNEVGIAMLGSRHTDFDAALAEIPELAARLAGAPVVQLPSRSRAVPTAHSCPHRRARAAGRRRLRLRGCDHGRGAPPRVCRGQRRPLAASPSTIRDATRPSGRGLPAVSG